MQPNFEPQWTTFLTKIHKKALDDTRQLWYNELKKIFDAARKAGEISEEQAKLLLERVGNDRSSGGQN